MIDIDRLLFLHYCKIQAEKQGDISFSSTEYDDIIEALVRKLKSVDNLEDIIFDDVETDIKALHDNMENKK